MPDISSSLIGTASEASPWGAAASAASGLIGTITGLVQQGKANKALKKLQYPVQSIPNEVLRNQKIAENMANTGLPSEQYNNAIKNIQRQQMMAYRAAADRRGILGSLPGIVRSGIDATANLDAADAQARQRNRQLLMRENANVGNWKNKIWENNVRDKYERDYNYAMSLKGAGNQNFSGGLDKIAGSAALFGGQGGFNGLFGGGSGGGESAGLRGYAGMYDRATPL